MHHRRILAARAFSFFQCMRTNQRPHIYIPFLHNHIYQHPQQSRTRNLHTSPRLRSDNHYSVLESTPSASAGHLKKQFYALSKRHHPDLHPDDSAAAERFVRISTAWSVLGNASKRAAYDRELSARDPAAFGGLNTNSSSAGSAPHGSHSSAQAATWGARPASGLSRRRGAFRGPPPSFYRAGGWGSQEGKRRAAAEGAESAAYRAAQAGRDGSAESAGSTSGNGGFAPGQGYDHADYEVPHFDRAGHFRRQEGVQETLRKRRVIWAEKEALARERDVGSGGGTWERILLVCSVLGATAVMGWIWEWRVGRKRDR